MAGARITIDLDSESVTAKLHRARDVLDGDGRTLLLEDIGEHLLNATKRRATTPRGHPRALTDRREDTHVPWMRRCGDAAKTMRRRHPRAL